MLSGGGTSKVTGSSLQNLCEIRAASAEKAGYYLDCALSSRSVDAQVLTLTEMIFNSSQTFSRVGTLTSSTVSTSLRVATAMKKAKSAAKQKKDIIAAKKEASRAKLEQKMEDLKEKKELAADVIAAKKKASKAKLEQKIEDFKEKKKLAALKREYDFR